MNVAVGGTFLGNPDKTTRFPAEMAVDYLRVKDKNSRIWSIQLCGAGKLAWADKCKP